MKDLSWCTKLHSGGLFVTKTTSVTTKEKKKKNIVEHNLSFAVKKTRDNPAKTPTYTRRDTGDPTLRLKISLNL